MIITIEISEITDTVSDVNDQTHTNKDSIVREYILGGCPTVAFK